jgi:hypothetical protein
MIDMDYSDHESEQEFEGDDEEDWRVNVSYLIRI